ncbi:hypothetical protein FA15DRAFT_656697 [Coprinopsis marcescibilis]|uniref:Uncharacterized protein n=1 Tax=Coprinopsis marcescibilis TaxID=230819 RepID=A0A5C3KTA4_COPMA|nr:hypothetical protein FA15DRAFT_656697 [Coprinopsis marcescibilis]
MIHQGARKSVSKGPWSGIIRNRHFLGWCKRKIVIAFRSMVQYTVIGALFLENILAELQRWEGATSALNGEFTWFALLPPVVFSDSTWTSDCVAHLNHRTEPGANDLERSSQLYLSALFTQWRCRRPAPTTLRGNRGLHLLQHNAETCLRRLVLKEVSCGFAADVKAGPLQLPPVIKASPSSLSNTTSSVARVIGHTVYYSEANLAGELACLEAKTSVALNQTPLPITKNSDLAIGLPNPVSVQVSDVAQFTAKYCVAPHLIRSRTIGPRNFIGRLLIYNVKSRFWIRHSDYAFERITRGSEASSFDKLIVIDKSNSLTTMASSRQWAKPWVLITLLSAPEKPFFLFSQKNTSHLRVTMKYPSITGIEGSGVKGNQRQKDSEG